MVSSIHLVEAYPPVHSPIDGPMEFRKTSIRSGERGQPELQVLTFRHASPPGRGYGILALMDIPFAWQTARISLLFGWNVTAGVIFFSHRCERSGGFFVHSKRAIKRTDKQFLQMIVFTLFCFESSQPQIISNAFMTLSISRYGDTLCFTIWNSFPPVAFLRYPPDLPEP